MFNPPPPLTWFDRYRHVGGAAIISESVKGAIASTEPEASALDL